MSSGGKYTVIHFGDCVRALRLQSFRIGMSTHWKAGSDELSYALFGPAVLVGAFTLGVDEPYEDLSRLSFRFLSSQLYAEPDGPAILTCSAHAKKEWNGTEYRVDIEPLELLLEEIELPSPDPRRLNRILLEAVRSRKTNVSVLALPHHREFDGLVRVDEDDFPEIAGNRVIDNSLEQTPATRQDIRDIWDYLSR